MRGVREVSWRIDHTDITFFLLFFFEVYKGTETTVEDADVGQNDITAWSLQRMSYRFDCISICTGFLQCSIEHWKTQLNVGK